MKISFRVNVKGVGFGHVKRCLSLAEQFVNKGCQVEFYVDDHSVSELFQHLHIHVFYVESEQQFLQTCNLFTVDLLIVDGYFADGAYINAIKAQNEAIYLVVLDSLKRGLMGADLLVNAGFYAQEFYAQELEQQKFLLGSRYTILGSEYKNSSKYEPREVQSILITMGGMDPQNITQQLLPPLLTKYPNINFYVVVGKYFSSKLSLAALAENNPNLHLLENLSSLIDYINQSDLCISSAGTTVFEIARCGRPVMLFAQEENQLYSSQYWEKTNGVLSMGYYQEQSLQLYMTHLDKLIEDREMRINMSAALLQHSTYGTAVLANEILDKFKNRKW